MGAKGAQDPYIAEIGSSNKKELGGKVLQLQRKLSEIVQTNAMRLLIFDIFLSMKSFSSQSLNKPFNFIIF